MHLYELCFRKITDCWGRISTQGGLFSDIIDAYPAEERLETAPGLTGVRVLEFDLLNFVNFEADIHFAEDEGIVQVRANVVRLKALGYRVVEAYKCVHLMGWSRA